MSGVSRHTVSHPTAISKLHLSQIVVFLKPKVVSIVRGSSQTPPLEKMQNGEQEINELRAQHGLRTCAALNLIWREGWAAWWTLHASEQSQTSNRCQEGGHPVPPAPLSVHPQATFHYK